MQPLVKICGITNLEDAEIAVSLGAAYLGFIFAESPRKMELDAARIIKRKLKGQVKFVGVFQNQEAAFLNNTADVLGLDFIQLHGVETADFIRILNHPVIKTVELPDPENTNFDFSTLSDLACHAFLFDRPKSDSNNSNWLANVVKHYKESLSKYQPFFIAGGLSSENLHLALSLEPFAVDLASSIESKPGVKDHSKMSEFFQTMIEGANIC